MTFFWIMFSLLIVLAISKQVFGLKFKMHRAAAHCAFAEATVGLTFAVFGTEPELTRVVVRGMELEIMRIVGAILVPCEIISGIRFLIDERNFIKEQKGSAT